MNAVIGDEEVRLACPIAQKRLVELHILKAVQRDGYGEAARQRRLRLECVAVTWFPKV